MNKFTHLGSDGRLKMVDVSGKPETRRTAVAMAAVEFEKSVFEEVVGKGVEKGDIFCVAKTAAIMAAKRTPDIIPLCHPLLLTKCDARFAVDRRRRAILVFAMARAQGATGVEMEAIVAALAAAATIYDMCKALSKAIAVADCSLLFKSGGKSGDYKSPLLKKYSKYFAEWL